MQIREMTDMQCKRLFTFVLLMMIVLIMSALWGCQSTLPKRVEVRADGSTVTTVDVDAIASMAAVANGIASRAIDAAQRIAEIRTALATKPMSAEEKLAAEQKMAIEQKLLDALLDRLNVSTPVASSVP